MRAVAVIIQNDEMMATFDSDAYAQYPRQKQQRHPGKPSRILE